MKPILKGYITFLRSLEWRRKQNGNKMLWDLVSQQFPQNFSTDLVNDNMKRKLLQIPLNLTFQHLCSSNKVNLFKLNIEVCA